MIKLVMKLFDFSIYAKRREAQQTADRVEALKTKLYEPGAVDQLKREVHNWMELHREVTKAS